MLASNVASGVYESVYADPRANFVEAVLVMFALLIIWLAFNGRTGAFLGAAIAPGGMLENSNPDLAGL